MCTGGLAYGDAPDKPILGRRIEDFTLNDFLGAKRSLDEWKDAKAVVVVFLGTECPLAKLYGAKLADLNTRYAGQDVQFVGINANAQDTLQEIAVYAHEHDSEFPLLKDAGAEVADKFGATRTPEAFVLDRDRVIRYHGRIDDQYGVGASRNKATHHELIDAIAAVYAGRSVTVTQTQAVGCLIGRRDAKEPTGDDVTYAKHIAPILQKRCVSCHREGEIAPFALTEYSDVAAWSDTMLEVIDQGRMPPWHANPDYGHFANDARMPEEEKKVFRQWVAGGAPEGNRADLPPTRKFPEGWQLPEPRVVYQMPEEFQVPATGTVPYKLFYFDPGFKEDKWVTGAEARPGNREVVHHILLFYLPPGQQKARPQDALFNAIAGYAPGLPAIYGPDAYALRIPAGSQLVFQVHYTPNGKATTDRCEAAVMFADPAKVEKELHIEAGLNFKFLIPPGVPDYKVTAERAINRDSMLYTLTPHMHYRGKSFRFTAHYPSGVEEILLDVPRYDFNWQNIYLLQKPKWLPAGTVIHMEGHFDNSADNPLNPDPTQTVYWGDQTWDEMMLGSMTLSDAGEDLRLGPPHVEPGDGPAAPIPNDGAKSNSAAGYRVHFRFRVPENDPARKASIDSVYLAGSFNDWKPNGLKMQGPDGEGFYTADVSLPAGQYEYKYVINGSEWRADPGNRMVAGYYGNSVLVVE
jgi:peroxiredoxin